MFKNPFSFDGRIRRTEFGISYIIAVVAKVFGDIGLIEMGGFSLENSGSIFLYLLLYSPLIWFFTAQRAKRCHDLGKSGWWQLMPFYIFWLLFANSKKGPNEYGPNPKGIGNPELVYEKNVNQV
jgi:uncharacterized membrane protein YhaH (DUF805 family)